MTEAMLQVSNLETYYGPIMAICGVSLEVRQGEIVAVLGANGAGKTTLLKTISGALNCRKGDVLLEGKAIQNRDPNWVAAQGLAHVPEGREVFPFLSVRDNLMLGAYRRSDGDTISADLETMYRYFPALKENAGKLAGYLSGGQQQMLAIARGYMSRPRLMVLDEPSLGLSPVLVQSIFHIIRRLNEEEGLTILLVEQNAAVALETSRRAYVMEVGGIVMDGPSAELARSDDIKEFYLGQKETGVRGTRRWKKRKTWR
ncbi:ABC transporter ATP-binding protein [Oceanibacterium hippocampi]|uniref:High-affinity branched-chain amino acid transport ATP-binding protein LivF n=1 Tax=Oceanibacterium hippocampi TaxID=745714 RepID=A0A1Y5SWL1_9PROT|nr:ABC transporter ATP-binding protein [Oceanibacterium hippocampi]SLN46705.1 High-affinity branched-chain amino acid transport ATP-binding protein LivF [Oceanibacterium hippocampi]